MQIKIVLKYIPCKRQKTYKLHPGRFHFIVRYERIQIILQHSTSGTISRCVPVIPDVFRWTKIAQDEDHTEIYEATISILDRMDVEGSQSFADSLPLVLDWFLDPDQTSRVSGKVSNDQLTILYGVKLSIVKLLKKSRTNYNS